VEIVDHKRTDDKSIKKGDRITFSVADSCGKCEYCLNNLSQKCKSLFKYGHANMSSGSGFNGSYASHIVLRKGTHIKKLPNEIDDYIGSTINCALATMVNCIDSIPNNIKLNGKKALIQGDGMLGLFGCALLNDLGFEKIYCTGHRTNRSSLVNKFGGIPLTSNDIPQDELNKIDCVIEACGNADVIDTGIKLLKPGGVYVFAGMVHPNSKLNITGEQIIRKCLTIKGVHNYNEKHLDQAVDFLYRTIDKYPFKDLVSPNVFELVDLPKAIEEAQLKTYPRVCVKP
jgi:threonine dehydrogenase-like Zn-dependent dehydrogenase